MPRRQPTDRAEAIHVLALIWEASGYLCAVRLKAALPHWLPWLRSRGRLTPEVDRALRRISARHMDRRVRAHQRPLTRTRSGTTRPGALLKHWIPIKTDHWDVTKPGSLEMDRVSHSGASAAGEFLHTLDCVDLHTGWVERQAGRGNGQDGILQALTLIEGQLPFALRGLDSDNGRACINTHLWACCQRPGRPPIPCTRSRPYKQDDPAPIAPKHGTHVRKLGGGPV
jgi:hypothetical protein